MAKDDRLVHVEMMISAASVYDAMLFAEQHKALAGSFHCRPVKHGGTDDNGQLQERPRIKAWLADYATEHPAITISEALDVAKEAGITSNRQSLSSAFYALMQAKVLKRIAPGKYVLRDAPTPKKAKKVAKKTAKKAAKKAARSKALPPVGQRISDKLLVLLKHAPEDGMQLQDLTKAAEAVGIGPKSVSPTLVQMMQKKPPQILRPAPGVYRISAAGERSLNAHHAS